AALLPDRTTAGKCDGLGWGGLSDARALDEPGVISEEGGGARRGEDRFSAPATTTGAATLFQEMQRWAIVWRMNAVLGNATGHWTAMNLAGPRSREVLASLSDIDLSPSAF